MSDHSRLVLGTAQLGMPYGIANRTGQPDRRAALEIVCTAWENGICEFDTAHAYGQSDQILGQIIEDLGITDKAKITTKPHPDLNHLDQDTMIQAIEQSLNRLHVNKLHCIMLHREEMLDLWQEGLCEILQSIVRRGMADHIGVSVYLPQKALQAIRTEGIEIIQLPANILDRRFEKAGVFESAEEQDKEIYIRSVFLQGLLLMDPGELPPNMIAAKPILDEVRAISFKNNVNIRHFALGYIKTTKPKAKLIIGAERASQLKEVISDADMELPLGALQEILNKFDDVDEKIINPTLWQR
jgi:aryl-alcohol dehydrogenase-like predicted oxidoreductase